MPAEREDNISDDLDETESQLARRVGTEMNWQEEVPQLLGLLFQSTDRSYLERTSFSHLSVCVHY